MFKPIKKHLKLKGRQRNNFSKSFDKAWKLILPNSFAVLYWKCDSNWTGFTSRAIPSISLTRTSTHYQSPLANYGGTATEQPEMWIRQWKKKYE